MPASVQDLIALANHTAGVQSGPFTSLLEGATQGFGRGVDNAVTRALQVQKLQMERDTNERAQQVNDQLMAQARGTQEANTQQGLSSATSGGKTPTLPAMKLASVTMGPDGRLKPEYKIPDKSLQTKEYTDPQGVNRIGKFNPETGQFITAPDDLKAPTPAGMMTLGDKQDQFYQKEFDKIVEKNNPNNASSRSVIGLVGRTNLNVNRALTTLSHPVVTNADAGNAMADIASTFQGGSATDFGMSQQGYDTLYGRLQKARQYVTGQPTDVMPDDIKAHVMSVLNEMRGVNQAVLKSNLDMIEGTQKKTLSRFPDEWKSFRQGVEGSTTAGGDTPPGGGPVGGIKILGVRPRK